MSEQKLSPGSEELYWEEWLNCQEWAESFRRGDTNMSYKDWKLMKKLMNNYGHTRKD